VKDIRIEPGERLTIARSIAEDDWFSGRDNVIAIDDEHIQKKGSFRLADAGDDVYLYHDGVLVDAVCYGNKQADEGWIGDPVRLPSNKYMVRVSSLGTFSQADWIVTRPGPANDVFEAELYFDAAVTPFSFPESHGAPIFREIEKARYEVLISIYLLTSIQLVALLCDLSSEKGVKVCILLEGNVVGYDIITELTLMRSLVDAGAEVYLINDGINGDQKRFSFLHNKYAVIDSERVIVTSENWTSGNLGPGCTNRGWGVVIESGGFAEYVKRIFLNDTDMRYGDVGLLQDHYPGLKPYSGVLTYGRTTEYQETAAYDARVMPVLSPDNSGPVLRQLIGDSETRVYSQQLDLGSSYRTVCGDSPLGWMSSAAERGVDARFILDSSANGGKNDAFINTINFTTDIKAISLNGGASFTLIHNKGLIIDDLVWVGSVNWTENSFTNNRELAVVIDSPEVTAFFAELFILDWGVNKHTVAETGLEIVCDVLFSNGRPIYVFTVSGPADSSYTWDVLGNGFLRGSDINRIVCVGLPRGLHTVNVTMNGTVYTASCEYFVAIDEEPPVNGGTIWTAAAVCLMAVGGAGIVIKRRSINR
jgi:HKD family nuclease